MNRKLFKEVIRYVVPAGMVLLPLLALAALPTPVPPVSGSEVTLSEVQAIIERIARFLIVVSVIIAVIAIIWGGILWVTTGGSEERKKIARSWVLNGVVGALIILAVGVILQTLAGLVARTLFG